MKFSDIYSRDMKSSYVSSYSNRRNKASCGWGGNMNTGRDVGKRFMTGPCREDNIFTDRKAGKDMKILRRVVPILGGFYVLACCQCSRVFPKCLELELTCQISKCKPWFLPTVPSPVLSDPRVHKQFPCNSALVYLHVHI